MDTPDSAELHAEPVPVAVDTASVPKAEIVVPVQEKQEKAKAKSKRCGAAKAAAVAEKKKLKKRKAEKVESESDSSSSSDSDSSESESEDEETDATSSSSSSGSSSDSSDDEETEKQRKKRRAKMKERSKRKEKDKKKAKKKRGGSKRKSKKAALSDSESSDADSETEDDDSEDSDSDEDSDESDKEKLARLVDELQDLSAGRNRRSRAGRVAVGKLTKKIQELKRKTRKKGGKKASKSSKLDYKRVDELWDESSRNWKLNATADDEESSEYDRCVFNVRRKFDWEGKYQDTTVDIKSKLLKEALAEVMEGVKGVSLVEETPVIHPNMLFLYLEDLRTSMKALKAKLKGGEKMKRKIRRRNENKVKHVKVLIKYLDKDFAATKKTLYPMLESGIISFSLLWYLYKPGTLAYTTTYGTVDEPRAFKIDLADKERSLLKGEWYGVEGRYLEYDGKSWGMGTMDCEVAAFKGARKITSLACYPLKYHKDEAKLREQLIARGKKFVALQGVHYRSHEGLAFLKKKRQVLKVNINGRVMVDPAIFRRLLPNYCVSTVKQHDEDDCGECETDSDDEACSCEASDDSDDERERTRKRLIFDEDENPQEVEVPVEDEDESEDEVVEKLEEVPGKNMDDESKTIPIFTDEEYLIASSLVLGFSFVDKLWLEFTVSGIKDIVWNEGAYESLVLEDNTKDIVRALVESHKYHPSKSIDDVIQGKGKGLVAVLHGPPGTGKTLTAEGISELLKCPLYMVSAGELGTDPRTMEAELQKILDIAHAWGAVLLLDEADVFLEKRTIQDIHRNALVSIFLRLLEYFQGILFLTTNRVETFDDAFQSRIHIALRYGELTAKAKKAVFMLFIERVRVLEGVATMPFTEADLTLLAKHVLNGRQIKNTVRTAQALAVNKGEALGMVHIRRVLDVAMAFERDLKGGEGYVDAMRQYM